MGAQVVGDGLVGKAQHRRALNGGLLQQEGGHPLVQALPQDLFHQPHDLREPGRHHFVRVIRHGGGLLHQPFIYLGGNDPDFCILFRLYGHRKLKAAHDAGSGKQAHVPVKQAVNRDFPPFL